MLADVLVQHKAVFTEELGTAHGVATKIHVDPQAPPCFCNACSITYALRDKITRELECLEKQGTIDPPTVCLSVCLPVCMPIYMSHVLLVLLVPLVLFCACN